MATAFGVAVTDRPDLQNSGQKWGQSVTSRPSRHTHCQDHSSPFERRRCLSGLGPSSSFHSLAFDIDSP
jgi:hypothetical protein